MRGRGRFMFLRKTAGFIEKLTLENIAMVVVGDINSKVKERMEEDKSGKLGIGTISGVYQR